MTKPIKETVSVALDNLRPEANFPLIQFAKKHLNIDIEKSMRDDIVEWARKNIFFNKSWRIIEKALSTLDSAVEYIQKAMANSNPKLAKKFFNYIKDKYAKMVVDKYMEINKDKFVEKTTAFGKANVLPKIFRKFDKEKIRLSKTDFQHLRVVLSQLVDDIEDTMKTTRHVIDLRNMMKKLPDNVQKIVLDKIMTKRTINDDLQKRLNSGLGTVVQDIQEGINNSALRAIRDAQVQEIYHYDGLIERALPASVRGLHDVDRRVVEQIALRGDSAKPEDLLNFEVASGARHNPTYNVGHTGPSNRSSTLLSKIAMYFASNHGLKHGKPQSMWVMVYEATKGINTTELVNKNVKWTELEFATQQLKPSHFLGAVRFELDPNNTNGKEIAFKAVEGFVNPKVHQGKYNKEGIEGDIKQFLDISKYYSQPAANKKPDMTFKLPKNSSQVASDRTFFQRVFDKVGLSSNPDKYKQERENQLKFVQSETPEAKAKRLAKEQEKMKFWHAFSEKGTHDPKTWLPTCQKYVTEMEEDQRVAVESEIRKMLKMQSKPNKRFR